MVLFLIKGFYIYMYNYNILLYWIAYEDFNSYSLFWLFRNFRIMEKNNTFIFSLNSSHHFTHLFVKILNKRFPLSFKTLLIGNNKSKKFYWTVFSYTPYKFFSLVKPLFSSFNSKSIFLEGSVSKTSILKNYVNLKKRSGFLKKRDKMSYYVLMRTNILKNYKNKKNILRTSFKKPKLGMNRYMDLKRKSFKIYQNNRFFLKNLVTLQKTKQFQQTKFFSKINKKNFRQTLLSFEFSLYNLLVRSKFVNTFEESIFFIKSGFVFLNGDLTTNPYKVINLNDWVSFKISKYYYNFYKCNLTNKIKLTFSLGHHLWRINRFKNNFYKQSPTKIPKKINRLIFFYEDSPSFLEINYVIMSFCIVKLPLSYVHYNFYLLKFVNLYLMRLYNWKYLT